MSFLAVGLLEEIGLAVTGLLEQTIGKTAAGTVAGAATGFFSDKIDQAVESGLEQLVGQERVKSAKEFGSELISETQAIQNQDISYWIRKAQKPKTIDLHSSAHNSADHSQMLAPVAEVAGNLTPDDIAKFAISMAGEVANQGFTGTVINESLAISNTVKKYPQTAELAGVLGAHLANQLPRTEEYSKVSSVYNGLNLEYNQVRETRDENGLKVFNFFDEVGQLHALRENTGFVIPAFYGVFMGPYSKNDNLPIDLVDYFSLHHDQGYGRGGFFHELSDLQYISRLSQNFSRFSDTAKPYARFGILYFSTLGNILAGIFNQTSAEEVEAYVNQQVGMAEEEHKSQTPLHEVDQDFYQAVKPLMTDQNITKFNFETEVKEGLISEYSNSSTNALAGNNPQALFNSFGQIEITIL